MSSRSPSSLLFAGLGAAALTLSPVAATATPLSLQDEASTTAEPVPDDAASTSSPVPEQTAPQDPALTPEDVAGAETGGDPEVGDSVLVVQDEEDWGDIEDPLFWEETATAEGFVSVACTADDTGYEVYEITEEAPEGSEWLVAILLSADSVETGWLDGYFLPVVGDQYVATDEEGEPVFTERVILCSADLENSEWEEWEEPDYTDPTFWTDVLTEEGYAGVSCALGEAEGDTYTLQDPAAGSTWQLLVLLDEYGFFESFFEPEAGQTYTLPGEYGLPSPIDGVVLCSADSDEAPGGVSPSEPTDPDDGAEEGGPVLGPVVETDVPPAPVGGTGVLAGIVALAGLTILGSRTAARR